jgi:RNA polymerase sigma-70 factor, ECF subfamily
VELNSALVGHDFVVHDSSLERPLDFDDVYRTEAMTVARWAARLGGPRVDAEDIVQEVFLKAREALPRLGDHRGNLKAWLYRTTLNEVRYRRRKNRLWGWLGGLAEDVAGERPSLDRSAPETVEHREAVARLYAALDELNEKYRQVLILSQMEERPCEEIAELMGARVQTVWVWLHRARAALAKKFQDVEWREP